MFLTCFLECLSPAGCKKKEEGNLETGALERGLSCTADNINHPVGE